VSSEPVEIFDVGPPGLPGPHGEEPDGADAGDTDDLRRGRGGSVPAWIPALAAVTALLALIGAVSVWRYRVRTVTTVRTVAAGAAVAVDAGGCPVPDPCQLAAASRLYAAVLAWDPGATLTTATDVRSAAGISLRSTVVADTSVTFANGSPLERARSVLTVVAQCVPGGGVVASSVRVDNARRVQVITVAGRPGCSVTVTSEAEDGVAVPVESLDDLAHRPGLQL
jgi:hypothetical protein